MASIIKRSYQFRLPNGKTETRKLEHWTIQYRDAAGKIQRVKGYKDRAATKQLAAKIELQHARGEQVMLDPFKVHNATEIDKHLADYIASLQTAGRDEMYIYTAKQRIERVIKEAKWESLTDIDANSFTRWRDRARVNPRTVGFRKPAEGEKRTASAETLNQYLDTVRAFTNWGATMGRMPGIVGAGRKGKSIAIALAGVGKVEGEDVRKRRALSDEQVLKLLEVAPADRAAVYRFGVSTGLRRAELEDLQWGDVHFRAIKPTLKLRVEATKAKRADSVPLPAGLADELRNAKPAGASDVDKVFPRVASLYFWKKDLAAAGIEYLDAAGRAADFHAGTRKTLATRMNRNGVPLAIAMKIMRHTDAKLTLVDYNDDDQLGISEAVASMPELSAPAKVEQQAAAGGK